MVEDLKIQSQNDTAKLAEAKQLVYLKVGPLPACAGAHACVCTYVCTRVPGPSACMRLSGWWPMPLGRRPLARACTARGAYEGWDVRI